MEATHAACSIHLGFPYETTRLKRTKFLKKSRCCMSRAKKEIIHFNYNEVYAPVTYHLALRMLVSSAISKNLILEGAEINKANIYGNMEVLNFMEHQRTLPRRIPALETPMKSLCLSMEKSKQAESRGLSSQKPSPSGLSAPHPSTKGSDSLKITLISSLSPLSSISAHYLQTAEVSFGIITTKPYCKFKYKAL